MEIIPASDSSLLIAFGNAISPALHKQVIALFHALQGWHDLRIRNLHPGYASLLIDFDSLRLTHDELSSVVRQLALANDSAVDRLANVVTIPVCYDMEFGPDNQPTITWHTTPELTKVYESWQGDPSFKARYEDILNRKRDAWRDRESDRKLVD